MSHTSAIGIGVTCCAGLVAALVAVAHHGPNAATPTSANQQSRSLMQGVASTPNPPGAGQPTTAAPSSQTAGTPAARTSSASPGSGSPSSAASTWLIVRFASECVTPGQTQTIYVQSRPGYVVAYDAVYSDGQAGTTYGGAGYSPTNSDGSYRSVWTVAPNAPLGPVKVSVGTQRGKERPVTAQATFTVASRC